ncbi:Zinc metalloprotease Rip1 [Corynebacterium aquatimens]|uniref:Zinc metalloprotease Rip1 n=2 Tax=Corynebacterium aquatimens TaxID=1190508 RepID=A0A931E161_9CORY|nr:membrane-associated protease RseP (regulator of RpoE activity) [Corynebacterium aquatimens]WJY65596.1 Zinc metalloprotease Rip1 [Corynebacterium aquatimens]
MFILGLVLFALGITASIALHEAGHMLTAKAFGMRVRRFFVGFGPPLVSKKVGETTYGIAAVPLGGFCEIAGMTGQDELTAEEEPRAMWRKPAWQRVVVMCGGIIMNLLLGILIMYLLAVTAGIPNPYADRSAKVGEVTCTADQIAADKLADCTGEGPAGAAGVRPGDTIVGIDGHEVATFLDVREYVLERPGQTVAVTIERNGARRTYDIPVDTVRRIGADGRTYDAGALGVTSAPITDAMKRFGPAEAVPATLRVSGDMLWASVKGLASFPAKIPGVVTAIFGGERDAEGPISVVGASVAGGELAKRSMWAVFFSLLASLNFFLALFNLVPLPPLDGGHIAVIAYEKLRNFFRRLRGLPAGGPVNYQALMPLTYAMAALLFGVGLLVIVADVVNPVRLF